METQYGYDLLLNMVIEIVDLPIKGDFPYMDTIIEDTIIKDDTIQHVKHDTTFEELDIR